VAARRKPAVIVEQSPSVRVEIRIGGRVRFLNDVYNVELSQVDDILKLTGALHPTMVTVELSPPEKFGEDPRDGEEPLLQVHSGKQSKE